MGQELKKRRSGWTNERRARQAEAIRRWAPWKKFTGPRTLEGKSISSRNAVLTGVRAEVAAILVQTEARFREATRLAREGVQSYASNIAYGVMSIEVRGGKVCVRGQRDTSIQEPTAGRPLTGRLCALEDHRAGVAHPPKKRCQGGITRRTHTLSAVAQCRSQPSPRTSGEHIG